MGDLNMRALIALAVVLAFVQYASAHSSVVEEEFTEINKKSKYHGCTLRCHQPSCIVSVFQHCNYGGYRINLKPGSYNMHQLKRMGMRNDDLSSVQVHGNCKATMYEHWNFTGKSKSWTRHDSCFTNDHMMSLLSIKVEEHNAEETAEETEFVQASAKAAWGRRRRRRVRSWNDQVSSIKVFNKNGKYCKMDCRERDSKRKEKAHKAKVAAEKAGKKEKADKKKKKEKAAKVQAKKEKAAKAKEKKIKAKIAAAKKKEKAYKKKQAAKKKIEKAVKAQKKRWKAFIKHVKEKKAKRAKKIRAHFKKIKEKMNKRFKKNKKKLKPCTANVKGKLANHYKGRCRAFARFCRLYKKYKMDATYYCNKMKAAHKNMMRHHKRL